MGAGLALDWINLRHVLGQRGRVPDAFGDFMDAESYQQSIDYTAAKTRFGLVNDLYEAAVLVAVLLSGLLPWLYVGLSAVFGVGVWGQALVLFILGMLLAIPGLPFDW